MPSFSTPPNPSPPASPPHGVIVGHGSHTHKMGVCRVELMQNAAQPAFANQTEAKKRRNKKKGIKALNPGPASRTNTRPDCRTARRENPALKKVRISDLGSKRPDSSTSPTTSFTRPTHPEHPSKTAGEQRHDVPHAACASGTRLHTPTPS